jgi:hypothetical protein
MTGFPAAWAARPSALMATMVVRHVFEANVSSVTFGYIITGWLAGVFAFFAFPLLAFSKPLSELKEKSTQVLGAQATQYFRGIERGLIGRNLAANGPAEAAQPPVPDPSAQLMAPRKLSIFLMSRSAIAPSRGAALIPSPSQGRPGFLKGSVRALEEAYRSLAAPRISSNALSARARA